MDYKKKEETSFADAKVKAGVTTVQALRNLLIPEATMKFGWAGQAISNRRVPMDRVPDLVITRSLDAKGRAPMKGRRTKKMDMNEDSSDEDLLDLGQINGSCRKKKTTEYSNEEYICSMMSKVKRKIATQMAISIEELDCRLDGKRTPPASKRPSTEGASALVSPDPGKPDEGENEEEEEEGEDMANVMDLLERKKAEFNDHYEREALIKRQMIIEEASARQRAKQERERDARKRVEYRERTDLENYEKMYHWLLGTVRQKMDNVLLRDLEARDDYQEAGERTDLLQLWSSVEAVVKRTGGDSAFTIGAAQQALSNRKMFPTETIASFIAAYRILVETLEEAGGVLDYPGCMATCIKNVDGTRFRDWVYDQIKGKVADSNMTLNELLDDLAVWDREVWRPFSKMQLKPDGSSDHGGRTGASSDRNDGKNRNVKENDGDNRPVCFGFRDGNCKYGDGCKFKHGENDNRTPSRSGPADQLCIQWLTGQCRFGDDCRYVHEISKETLAKMNKIGGAHVGSDTQAVNRRVICEMPLSISEELPEAGKQLTLTDDLAQTVSICRRVKRPPAYYMNTSDRGVLSEDNGCNVSLVWDRGVIDPDTLTVYDEPVTVTSTVADGVALQAHGEGRLRGVFDFLKVYWCPKATGNLIAGKVIRDNFQCGAWDRERKMQVHRRLSDGKKLKMVENFEHLMVCVDEGMTGECRSVKHRTLQDKLQDMGHSKDSIKRARMAGVLHKRMDYAPRGRMLHIIQENRINDLKLDEHDVTVYFDEIHDKECVGCASGRMTRYPAMEREAGPCTCVGQVVYMDEFHISFGGESKAQRRMHYTYMLCVDGYSAYKNTFHMRWQGSTDVYLVVGKLKKFYEARGHKLAKIVMDAAMWHVAAVDNIKALGVDVEVVGPNRHVTVAEVGIRDLKRSFLCVLFGLSYKLHRDRYENLVTWNTDSLNIQFSGKNDRQTPWELMHRKKISMEYHLGASFGELVVVANHGDSRDKSGVSVTPTGVLGLVVGREWNTPGGLRVKKLFGGTKVIRTTYAPFEMTPEYKERLEREVMDDQEPKDVHFTWENVTDKDWGRITVEDDTRIVEIEETDEQSDDEGDVAVEIEPVVEPADRLESVVLEACGDNEDVREEDLEDIAAGETDPEGAMLDDTTEGVGLEGVSLNEPAGEEDVVNEESMKDMLIQKSKDLPKRGTNAWRAANLQRMGTRSSLKRLGKYLRVTVDDAIRLFGKDATTASVNKEFQNLLDKEVFKFLTPFDVKERTRKGEIILPCSLFLKDKYDAFGEFEKLKAGLVACGNYEELLRKMETESPTISIHVLLIILEIAARDKMCVKSVDVPCAYLNGVSEKRHMMKLGRKIVDMIVELDAKIEEYRNSNGSIVVELEKCLYGLQEAAKVWYDLISKTLMDAGFTRSEWDKCLFHKKSGDKVVYVVLYVDDMLLSGTDEACVNKEIEVLNSSFSDKVTIKEGKQISFLGLEVHLNGGHILVSQGNYLKQILEDLKVVGTEKSPAADNLMDKRKDDDKECDKVLYRRTVYRLMYAAIRTRPDILYSNVILSGRCETATETDWKHAMRILKYINGTLEHGLVFNAGSQFKLWMSVDASFNHHWDCKGHSAIVIYGSEKDNSSVLCKSAKQKSVADSSTEAELIALHDAVKHLVWVSHIYAEIGYETVGKIEVQQDNKACILLSSDDPVNFKGRSKFIDRKYFSVYEHVKSGMIELVFTGTGDMVSDFLTKALNGAKYRKFKVEIMGVVLKD